MGESYQDLYKRVRSNGISRKMYNEEVCELIRSKQYLFTCIGYLDGKVEENKTEIMTLEDNLRKLLILELPHIRMLNKEVATIHWCLFKPLSHTIFPLALHIYNSSSFVRAVLIYNFSSLQCRCYFSNYPFPNFHIFAYTPPHHSSLVVTLLHLLTIVTYKQCKYLTIFHQRYIQIHNDCCIYLHFLAI